MHGLECYKIDALWNCYVKIYDLSQCNNSESIDQKTDKSELGWQINEYPYVYNIIYIS